MNFDLSAPASKTNGSEPFRSGECRPIIAIVASFGASQEMVYRGGCIFDVH
jgi:hypothetical protein